MPGDLITSLSDNVLLLLLREASWEILLLFVSENYCDFDLWK